MIKKVLLLNYLLALTAGLQRVDFVKFFHNDNYGTVFLREKNTGREEKRVPVLWVCTYKIRLILLTDHSAIFKLEKIHT
jgi:hypothetical protein